MSPVGNATPGQRRATPPRTPPRDLAAATDRPRAARAAADFAVTARTLQLVAESLSETAGPRAGGPVGGAAADPGKTARAAPRRRFGRGGAVDLLALAAYLPQR